MSVKLLSMLKDWKTLAGIGLIIGLDVWSLYRRNTYLYFLAGALSVIVLEIIMLWFYLAYRVRKQNQGEFSIDLAHIEVKKIFGEVDYHEVINKAKKKKYYENNKSKPMILNLDIANPRPRPEKIEVKEAPVEEEKEPQSALSAKTPTLEVKDPNQMFSHKQINELIKMKDTTTDASKIENKGEKDIKKFNLEEKMKVGKIGRKAYLHQVHDFTNILNLISDSEKNHGKYLLNVELKQGVFNQEESILLKPGETYINYIKLKLLNEKELNFLKEKYKEDISRMKYLHLPEWKNIIKTLNLIGQINTNCTKFIQKVSITTITNITTEHGEKYEEFKKEKKRLTKEYEDAYTNYMKLKAEYDTLNKTLEATLGDYQVMYKKKKDDEVVLKHEMKARLVKSQLDSLGNKLSSSEDKLKDSIRAIEAQNEKISNFKQWRDEKRDLACQCVLKGIVLKLGENIRDVESSIDVLFRLQDKIPSSAKKGLPNLEEDKSNTSDLIKSPTDSSRGRRRGSLTDSSFERTDIGQITKPPKRSTTAERKKKEPEDTKEANLNRMLEDFKDRIEEVDVKYNENIFMHNEEIKKGKSILSFLKQLEEYEAEYNKERDKLMSNTFLKGKVDSLATYWKMIQSSIYLVNKIGGQFRDRIIALDKQYGEFMKNAEKEFKASDVIIQNALKKATTYTKNFEKELQKKEAPKDKKVFLSKLFNFEGKASFNEESITNETANFNAEVEKGISQIQDLIKKYKTEITNIKKEVLMAYSRCCTGQREIFSTLVREVEQNKCEERFKEYEEVKEEKKETPSTSPKMEGAADPNEPKDDPSAEVSPNKRSKSAVLPSAEKIKSSEILKNDQLEALTLETPAPSEKKEIVQHEIEEWKGPEHLYWVNRMLKVFAIEWSKSAYFKEKITKIFFRAFNKKRSKFVRRINIKDLKVDTKFPDIRSITPLPSDPFEFLCDFELAYQGNAFMEIETRLEPQPIINIISGKEPIPLTAKILLKSFNAKLRICWVPSDYGRSWFSFVGQPILNVSVEPKIGASQFDVTNIPQATSIIMELLMKRIKKMTFPYRKELDLPLAFRDPKIVLPPE